MFLDVIDRKGDKVSEIDVKDALFGAKPKEHLFYEVVKMQRANRRSGTACTKTKGEVSGGGAKPFKQKGTGRARQGSNRSPINRHGGTVFGPKPRDYSYRVPKKVATAALISAFQLKINESRLKVIENLDLKAPRTREISAILKKIGTTNALIVTDAPNRNIELAVRNMKDFKVLRSYRLTLYDILRYKDILVTRSAVGQIEKRLGL